MYLESAKRVLKQVGKKEISIVGAGRAGREITQYLLNQGVHIRRIYDNNGYLSGKNLFGIPIELPHKKMNQGETYVLAFSDLFRAEVRKQLETYGIFEENIVIYSPNRDFDFMNNLNESEYKEEISAMFRDIHGYDMNWENPKTYNEIINWEKLNVHDERRVRLADKYLVRKWISHEIGEKYLTCLFGKWDSVEDIDFSLLPKQYVLKTNNGSGRNIFVRDNSSIDREQIKRRLKEWLEVDFSKNSLEMQYHGIIPCVICEEYLEGVAETVCEYNIYCFHGEPRYIWCIRGSHRPECRAAFYDMQWNKQEFSYGYPYDPMDQTCPKGLDEMLKLSRKLSKDFRHVRVDWNNLPDGRILFSEMTFSSWAGLKKFVPTEMDDYFGELIRKPVSS